MKKEFGGTRTSKPEGGILPSWDPGQPARFRYGLRELKGGDPKL